MKFVLGSDILGQIITLNNMTEWLDALLEMKNCYKEDGLRSCIKYYTGFICGVLHIHHKYINKYLTYWKRKKDDRLNIPILVRESYHQDFSKLKIFQRIIKLGYPYKVIEDSQYQ